MTTLNDLLTEKEKLYLHGSDMLQRNVKLLTVDDLRRLLFILVDSMNDKVPAGFISVMVLEKLLQRAVEQNKPIF